MKRTIATTLLLSLAICALAQPKKISKSFTNVKTIQIKTSSGDITIRRGAGSEVKLDLSYTYDDKEFTPQMEQTSNKLVLTEEFTKGSHSGSSKWSLTVPDNMTINTNTGSGNISIEDISADIKANLGSGNVEVGSLKGGLNLNTGSGDISVSKVDGETSINTGSGDITIEQGSGSMSLNAGSGNLDLQNLNGQISANTGSGNIKARTLTLTGKSKFNTGSGDASVSLARALDHDISVNSGSGDATLNFNGAEISGEVVMTANKRGGDIVAPFKFDKEETIDDGDSSPRIQKTAVIGSKNIKIKVGTGTGTAEIKK